MCDVDNPLCGPNGASAVFGPQKGADPDMVTRLDRNLRHLSEVIRQDLGREIADLPGAGAAGGMGAGVMAFLGSRLQMGIETVLDTVGFDALLPGATAVLTGEGRIDCQSLRGKVVIGIAHPGPAGTGPGGGRGGRRGPGAEDAYQEGVTAIVSTNRRAVPWEVAASPPGQICAPPWRISSGSTMRSGPPDDMSGFLKRRARRGTNSAPRSLFFSQRTGQPMRRVSRTSLSK